MAMNIHWSSYKTGSKARNQTGGADGGLGQELTTAALIDGSICMSLTGSTLFLNLIMSG